eukprot:gene1323-1669_t
MNSKIICVTGSTGYIASYIVKYLLESPSGEYKVRACVHDINNPDKLSVLKNLDPSGNSIEFVACDLETSDFKEILKDCYALIHTATPYIHTANDPENEIVKPAVTGTVRVLEAAAQISTLKRVVLTSSAGAIINSLDPNLQSKSEYTEEDWNTTSSLTNQPYFYSKVLAEKAAWDFLKENNSKEGTNHFELSVICPTFITGPGLSPNLNTSQKLVLRLLFDAHQPFPTRVGIVDVRDVAKAHVLALESNKSSGQRYLVGCTAINWNDIPATFENMFPDIQFNICKNLIECKIEWELNNTKTKQLGLNFTPINQSFHDMIIQFKNFNLLKSQTNS